MKPMTEDRIAATREHADLIARAGAARSGVTILNNQNVHYALITRDLNPARVDAGTA
jgi:hypothetical protein